MSHDVLVVTLEHTMFLPLSARRFSINLFSSALFLPCPQGVSQPIWIINRSSWWIITSLSAVVFFELSLRLIIMDNNVRGHVLLITSNFLSLVPCRI